MRESRGGEMKIAYPRPILDDAASSGRATLYSELARCIGSEPDLGNVEGGSVPGLYFPPARRRLFDGASRCANDMWYARLWHLRRLDGRRGAHCAKGGHAAIFGRGLLCVLPG